LATRDEDSNGEAIVMRTVEVGERECKIRTLLGRMHDETIRQAVEDSPVYRVQGSDVQGANVIPSL
jgi:hypothetical protein